jgi:hypothetical protein
MTMPVVSEGAVRIAWHRQLTARCAVGAARLLVKLPPKRLARVLRAVSRGAAAATPAQALDARSAVVSVSVRCAGQRCLDRSVAAALLCRLYGSWPAWCTGIRTRPFRAHAWIEADGRAVGEPGDIRLYRTVLAVRPLEGSRR